MYSYPEQVCNVLLKRLNSNMNKTKEQTVDNRKKVWLNLPYLGDKGDHLTKSLIRKLNKCFNENVKLIKRYKTNKLAMFCSNKDHIHIQQKANIIYRITCPGCYNKYIGKLTEILERDWTNAEQNLISQCIYTLQTVFSLQNV